MQALFFRHSVSARFVTILRTLIPGVRTFLSRNNSSELTRSCVRLVARNIRRFINFHREQKHSKLSILIFYVTKWIRWTPPGFLVRILVRWKRSAYTKGIANFEQTPTAEKTIKIPKKFLKSFLFCWHRILKKGADTQGDSKNCEFWANSHCWEDTKKPKKC